MWITAVLVKMVILARNAMKVSKSMVPIVLKYVGMARNLYFLVMTETLMMTTDVPPPARYNLDLFAMEAIKIILTFVRD